jgi:uncharacterized protein (TIGR00255 family)
VDKKVMNQRLASMTGYARNTGSVEGHNFQCEIKSVNARGLDIRVRMAPGLDALEPRVRSLIARRLTRGSISCTLTLQRQNGAAQININQQALGAVLDALQTLAGKVEAERPGLDGILGIKGVLETRELPLSVEVEERLHLAIYEAVERAIDDLVDGRRQEGAHLGEIITAHVDEIQSLSEKARDHPSRDRKIFMERIRRQIDELREADAGLSEERLHQEALILATKADIREELDRLFAHVKAARTLIGSARPVGRKLDFLTQEFNREANTLCSKSHAIELTSIGLDLKAAIDQLREQVQNIE